ncbi:MAG: hypothetical protein ACXAB4_08540, partial [Candidatus Hodarchaeales archaeon]
GVIQLLFQELKTRQKLAQESYHFDEELPRTIFQSLNVQPWMYTDITGFWILRSSGVPIFSLNWRQKDEILDHFQIASLLGAVSIFAESLGRQLHEITLEGIRVLFLQDMDQGLIFSMATPASSMPASQGLSLLSGIRDAFVTRYSHFFTAGYSITNPENFKDFSNELIDYIFKTEFEIYLKTGVLRLENPLLFQLARKLLTCKGKEMFLLGLLEKDRNIALSVQKISKKTLMPESSIRRDLKNLEDLGLIRRFRDGRSYKYASDLRTFLFAAAADPNTRQLTDVTIAQLLQLIDDQFSEG